MDFILGLSAGLFWGYLMTIDYAKAKRTKERDQILIKTTLQEYNKLLLKELHEESDARDAVERLKNEMGMEIK